MKIARPSAATSSSAMATPFVATPSPPFGKAGQHVQALFFGEIRPGLQEGIAAAAGLEAGDDAGRPVGSGRRVPAAQIVDRVLADAFGKAGELRAVARTEEELGACEGVTGVAVADQAGLPGGRGRQEGGDVVGIDAAAVVETRHRVGEYTRLLVAQLALLVQPLQLDDGEDVVAAAIQNLGQQCLRFFGRSQGQRFGQGLQPLVGRDVAVVDDGRDHRIVVRQIDRGLRAGLLGRRQLNPATGQFLRLGALAERRLEGRGPLQQHRLGRLDRPMHGRFDLRLATGRVQRGRRARCGGRQLECSAVDHVSLTKVQGVLGT